MTQRERRTGMNAEEKKKQNTSRRTAAGKQSFLSVKYCEQFKLVHV